MRNEEKQEKKTLANTSRITELISGKMIISDTEQHYKCSKCKDLGWIYYTGADGVEYTKECECCKKEKAEQRLRKTGVSSAIKNHTFDTYKVKSEKQKQIKDKAKRYVELIKSGAEQSLLVMGNSGTGKTHITFAITNELINIGKGVYYMPYRDTITRIKQNITNDIEYYSEMDKLKEAEYLVIDDFLKGNITQSDVNIMYEIVNHRYLNEKPIILCTEKTEKDILAFDEATGSRLLEMAGSMRITTIGIGNQRLEEV